MTPERHNMAFFNIGNSHGFGVTMLLVHGIGFLIWMMDEKKVEINVVKLLDVAGCRKV